MCLRTRTHLRPPIHVADRHRGSCIVRNIGAIFVIDGFLEIFQGKVEPSHRLAINFATRSGQVAESKV